MGDRRIPSAPHEGPRLFPGVLHCVVSAEWDSQEVLRRDDPQLQLDGSEAAAPARGTASPDSLGVEDHEWRGARDV